MKSKVVTHVVAVLSLSAGTLVAHADDTQGKSSGVATFGQLDEIRSQNAMLEASIKNAELRRQLVSGKASPGAAQATSPMPVQSAAPPAPPAPAVFSAASSTPTVTAEVDMIATDAKNRLMAILILQNGRRVRVYVGSDIAGLGVIKSISIDEVVALVSTGKKSKLVTLPSAAEPTFGNSGATAGPMPGMPGLSTVMPPIPAMMRGGR